MAKKKLISEPSSYTNLFILGINSQIRDYRMAYLVNHEAGLMMKRLDDLPVFNETNSQLPEFPLFYCYKSDSRIQYYLLSNNHPTTKLIPSYKQADYLFMIKGPAEPGKINEIASRIRTINGVFMVFEISLPKVKNLEGLMTDLELHMVGK